MERWKEMTVKETTSSLTLCLLFHPRTIHNRWLIRLDECGGSDCATAALRQLLLLCQVSQSHYPTD